MNYELVNSRSLIIINNSEMKYIISYQKPHTHFIDIEFIADNIKQDEVLIQLPSWRPGRYELGNFAKNVQKWAAFDGKGNALSFQKTTKDCWKVQTKGVSSLHIKYNYYAVDLNAGSTYLDALQLYMNPVNCCVYIPDRMNEPCELDLKVPEDYKVAIGLKKFTAPLNQKQFIAKDFHELADSPFIASNTLKIKTIFCGDNRIPFHLWFQGECKPEWLKLFGDFEKFCTHQLETMQRVPFEEYHFLFQILPTRFYHGVEHTTSTVIALGPGYNLMKGDLYEDLLGVSCHELYHAWNIKTIRPIEMQPYDYTKENYSKLGYVCEGVTTYYGDYLLFRSGVYNEEQYFKSLNERLQKHYDNFGRYNLSVADSSFDTWLDGYVPGIPNRKTSIYDEGSLLAFCTDIFIRKNSNNKNTLDDVMRFLYTEFALKNKGYSDTDFKGVVEHFANSSFDTIYNSYINKAADYTSILNEAAEYIGYELVVNPSWRFAEHAIGLKTNEVGGVAKVLAVYPDSVADVAGIAVNDDIISINNMQVKPDGTGTNFSEWCSYFGNVQLTITVFTGSVGREVTLIPQPNSFYKMASIQKLDSATANQLVNFKNWSLPSEK